ILSPHVRVSPWGWWQRRVDLWGPSVLRNGGKQHFDEDGSFQPPGRQRHQSGGEIRRQTRGSSLCDPPLLYFDWIARSDSCKLAVPSIAGRPDGEKRDRPRRSEHRLGQRKSDARWLAVCL